MKAASQQRRTLSFKEGLQEIKKSMGKGSGQSPEETPPAPETPGSKPARKGPAAHAKDARPRARPQQPGGRPQGAKPRPPKEAREGRAQQPGQRPAQQRQRPVRAAQPAANLTEEEKARIERNRQLNTVWNVLAKLYPAFRDRLPLKIGVAEDLVARHPEYERTLIVAVLKRHVNHPRYHERVAAGGSRYELDGSASAGPGIDPSHVGRANAALARQKAKAEAQAKAREAGAEQPPKAAAQPQPAGQAEPEQADAKAPAQAAAVHDLAAPDAPDTPQEPPAAEA
ncbi:ProQ/FINO family protein [Paraburkholderia sp. B3]|uniref:ProQ/FINO family protein n=1 Tax=Paraburkholderia sp. B3 TaxID=3134791 RepID=UPI00398298F5